MPEVKPKRLRVYTKLCRHLHISGRRCTVRFGRNAYGDFPLSCHLHTEDYCSECVAMMKAFPIRKTLRETL